MTKRVTLTLHGSLIAGTLSSLAWEYAFKSINRVATVREAPKFGAPKEARWRELRDTLESALGETLPDVGEPEWPVRYLLSDRVVTKSEPLGPFRVVKETKLRKGAKQAPTYCKGAANKHANAWRDAFLVSLGLNINAEGVEQ